MAKKKSQSEMPKGRYVRFYYRFEVICVFPENPDSAIPGKKRGRRSDGEWAEAAVDELACDVGSALGDDFDGVIVERHEVLDPAFGLYAVTLITSSLREVSARCFSGAENRFKPSALAKEDRAVMVNIRSALASNFRLRNLERILVASRCFMFRCACSGRLLVEREFSDVHIRDAGGVSEAFKEFEDEMAESGRSVNVTITPRSPRRRRADNRYAFDVEFRQITGFGEEDVGGDLVSMCREDSSDLVDGFWVELLGVGVEKGERSASGYLQEVLSDDLIYPVDVEFVELTDLAPWVADEEPFDADNEITV